MKLIKLIALFVLLYCGYAWVTNTSALENNNDDLKEWKKHASSALKSAMGWQALVNEVDAQDLKDAPRIAEDLAAKIPDIQRKKAKTNLPELKQAYVEASPYVQSYFENAKAYKVREYNVLEFAIQHNDIDLAEQAYIEVEKNREDLKYISAAKIAYFYATNNQCDRSKPYLDKLAVLKNKNDFFINHTKEPKSGTYSFAKRVSRIWSQTALLCNSLDDAFNILAKHYPMRITNDQFLLETYIDFAIVLKKSGYDTDASRFLNLANQLFENGVFDNPHNAKGYILLYSLMFDSPEKTYSEYLKFVEKYKAANPESSLLNISFLNLVADKFILNNDFDRALKVMEGLKITHKTGLKLLIDRASSSLPEHEQIQFFKALATTLQTQEPFSSYYLYEPLLAVALRLTELNENKQADEIVENGLEYLKNGDQSQNDKYFKKRAIETLGKYLIFMGKVEEAQKLLHEHKDIKSSHIYKAWGALYGYYIYENNEDGIKTIIEKNGEIGALTVNAAIDYLLYKQDWKKAEQLTEKLKEDHKIGQYKTFANRKMGLSFNDTFHENRMEAFQFNEPIIINAKLCRLYNHCKK